jgi:hypothetical protein
MTRDEIIEMAKQADIWQSWLPDLIKEEKTMKSLEAFAKLIEQSAAAKATASEREACATMLEDWNKHAWNPFDCAEAIRARAEQA